MGGEGRGGRSVVPHLSPSGGLACGLGPGPPPLRRRIPPWYTWLAGVVGQPRAPGAAWPAADGSAWRGQWGVVSRPPPLGGSAGGPRGVGGGNVSLPRSVGGCAPRWVASSVPRPSHCIGSCPGAAVPLRPMGRP